MPDFLVNPHTIAAIDLAIKRRSHALLLVGKKGSGKTSLAKELVSKINPKATITIITPQENKKSIGIEEIRNLRQFMQTKSTSNLPERAVIITPAIAMTEEAQNALLKTLEEPALGSMIILVAEREDALLETVHSRVHKLRVLPVSLESTLVKYSHLDNSLVEQAYHLSAGAGELIDRILNHSSHELQDGLNLAKEFLTSDRFARLSSIDKLKDSAEDLIAGLASVAKAALRQEKISQIERVKWQARYHLIVEAELQLQAYVNKKSVLMALGLSL